MCQVKELKDRSQTNDNTLLFCTVCGGEFSADKADYFWAKEDDVLKCCDEPLQHLIKKITYEKV